MPGPEAAEHARRAGIAVGSRVRIAAGMLEGYEGVVVQSGGARDLLQVRIEGGQRWRGRAPILLERSEVSSGVTGPRGSGGVKTRAAVLAAVNAGVPAEPSALLAEVRQRTGRDVGLSTVGAMLARVRADRLLPASTWAADNRTRVEDRVSALIRIIEEQGRPLGVRSVFYLAVAAGILPKTENAYKRTIADLIDARMDRRLPMASIVDDSREVLSLGVFGEAGTAASDPVTAAVPDYGAVAAAMRASVDGSAASPQFDPPDAPILYMPLEPAELAGELAGDVEALEVGHGPWDGVLVVPVVLLEKQGLASIVRPVCERHGVPFLACRGGASITVLHDLHKMMMRAAGAWTWRLLVLFDFDGSGIQLPTAAIRRMRAFDGWRTVDHGVACGWDWERIAVTEKQIATYGLPTRPPKRAADPDGCVELDALPPDVLAGLVDAAIRGFIPDDIEERRRQAEDDAQGLHDRRVRDLADEAVDDYQPVGDPALEDFADVAAGRFAEYLKWFNRERPA